MSSFLNKYKKVGIIAYKTKLEEVDKKLFIDQFLTRLLSPMILNG
jgi:hypothetical protein